MLVPPPERDGAADGAAPPVPPPDGIDGRLTAPPLPLRDGGPEAGAGALLDRLGTMIGSERGALGTLYERERDSVGSLRRPGSGSPMPVREVAGCRSVPIRERGATDGAGASSVAIRARGAFVSGMLLPTRDRGADEPTGSTSCERGEEDSIPEPARGSVTPSDAGIDGATLVRDVAASREGAVRLAAPPDDAVASPPRSAAAAMPLEGTPRGTARGPVGARNGSARETAMLGAAGIRRASANCVRTAGEIASTATACCATTTWGLTTGTKLRAGTTVQASHGPYLGPP